MSNILSGGPFTQASALDAGLTTDDLTRLLAEGTLVRPFRGVYLPTYLGQDVNARARAAGLLLPPGAALAREAAAWMHGVDIRPPERYRQPPALECVSDSRLHMNRFRRPEIRGHLCVLPAQDVVTVAGVPLTSPARTVLDLARYTEEYMGLAALDMFSHRRLITLDEIRLRIGGMGGQRCINCARRMLAWADHRAESPGESWTRLRIRECELPVPDLQISLRDETGKEQYRLDMGYHEERVAFEYDGEKHHRRTSAQAAADDARRREIRDRWGWTVYSFHAGDVLGQRPVVEQAIIEILGLGMEAARRRW